MPVAKPSVLGLRTLFPAVLLLVGAAVLILSGAQAAGGPIQVTEARQQVIFPEGVMLAVTAESEAEIVEVRVFFQASGSRTWAYAYADFEPGLWVVATRSIPVSESAYLAPGVDVEYYFQIRDALGNVFKTERATVEYLDDRYEWRRVNIGPLELVYHDIDDRRMAAAARDIGEDLQRVVELLQFEPRSGFKGVIYNSYADANAVFPVQSQTTTDHGTFVGYAFPEQGVFVGQGLDRRIIVHESTHLLLRDALGEKALDAPAWLDEGFATYNEPNVRIRSSSDLHDRTPPLRGMNRVSGTPRTIPLFYHKSVSVVAYLIEEYGEDNFRRMLGELSKGRTIEDALLNVYGFDVDGLDDRWIGLPVQPAATPVPTAARSVRPTPESAPANTAAVIPPVTSTDERERSASAALPATPVPVQDNAPVALSTPVHPQRQPIAPPQRQEREEPSPFVFIDVWVLAGVALLVALVLGLRFVYSRLRRNRRGDYDDSPYRDDWDC